MRDAAARCLILLGCAIAPAHAQPAQHEHSARSGCDCGTVQFHTGTDWSAKPGTLVPVADDGVVVRIENNEQALVQTSTGGYCGRYIVVRHTHRNGRVAFTRYAQLERIAGKDDTPLAVGSKLAKGDPVGTVGSKGILHFEVRPFDEKNADNSPQFRLFYAADATMEWARYSPVDAEQFDFDTFESSKKN
jgi:murein DD-endopeptidase MepM/ murein hydrolase activator NlpD